jgi:hypothetical protein
MQSQASPQTCRACNGGVAVLEWIDDEQILRYRPLPNNFSVGPEDIHDWWIWPTIESRSWKRKHTSEKQKYCCIQGTSLMQHRAARMVLRCTMSRPTGRCSQQWQKY